MTKKGYTAVKFQLTDVQQGEMLIAELSSAGYYGFLEEDDKLTAYIESDQFSEEQLAEVAEEFKLRYTTENIAEQNWNQNWEQNFEPVLVDDFVAIRADFHAPIHSAEYEIVITPKMSFGTGHHATTFLVMQQMRNLDFSDKSVLDFGSGTGILAILAEKLGAKHVLAIDNDSWCIENSAENIERNNSNKIEIRQAEEPPNDVKFDVILANINKHIIEANLFKLAQIISEKGIILLSGLLVEDEPDIAKIATALHMKHANTYVKEKWICIKLFS